jgi:hypothetical protein
MAWGNPYFGGKKAPTNSGYIEIYSNERAFAALKADGSITTWGSLNLCHQVRLYLHHLVRPTP